MLCNKFCEIVIFALLFLSVPCKTQDKENDTLEYYQDCLNTDDVCQQLEKLCVNQVLSEEVLEEVVNASARKERAAGKARAAGKGVNYPGENYKIVAVGEDEDHEEEAEGSVEIAVWEWHHLKMEVIGALMILTTAIAQLGYHHAHWISNLMPETCVLVIIGGAVGGIIHFTADEDQLPHFTPDLFFYVLLPPIVLEAAYSLHDRIFFNNLFTILLYAVVGTVWNMVALGFTIYGLTFLFPTIESMGGHPPTLIQIFVYASLLSAVDPVAVLAIFSDIGVNKQLYFLVFGESLLNDAVTIVLYNMMCSLAQVAEPTLWDFGKGGIAFIVSNVCSIIIGGIIGITCSIITKYTQGLNVAETLVVMSMAYLSYLMADIFHFSGIVSLVVCGLLQAHYAFHNIDKKSLINVQSIANLLSSVSDMIFFVFFGMEMWNITEASWNTALILWSLLSILVYRFIGTYFLTWIVNKYRTHKVGWDQQFILAYGGLRGAVGTGLVLMINEEFVPQKHQYVTAALMCVLITVFVQGGTVKPLVLWLNLKAEKIEKTLNKEIASNVIDTMMGGIEALLGHTGDNRVRQWFVDVNDKYIKPVLLTKTATVRLRAIFEDVVLESHYANLYGPVADPDNYNDIQDETSSIISGRGTSLRSRKISEKSMGMSLGSSLAPMQTRPRSKTDAHDAVPRDRSVTDMDVFKTLRRTRNDTIRVSRHETQDPAQKEIEKMEQRAKMTYMISERALLMNESRHQSRHQSGQDEDLGGPKPRSLSTMDRPVNRGRAGSLQPGMYALMNQVRARTNSLKVTDHYDENKTSHDVPTIVVESQVPSIVVDEVPEIPRTDL